MSDLSLRLMALSGLPTIAPGDDLCGGIVAGLRRARLALEEGDIVVVAQKVVSKAEGRLARLDRVVPSERARALAEATGKDPRLVETVLGETAEVLRTGPNVLIVRHRLGHVMANAGIDRSNLDVPVGEDVVLLLPADPDGSARSLRVGLEAACQVRLGVIISDSFGRPWRLGTVGTALGVAGPPAVIDRRGEPDRQGRPLEVTEVGFADSVAAAAVLVMGEGDEGCPVVVARGLDWRESGQGAADGLRPLAEDLFR